MSKRNDIFYKVLFNGKRLRLKYIFHAVIYVVIFIALKHVTANTEAFTNNKKSMKIRGPRLKK